MQDRLRKKIILFMSSMGLQCRNHQYLSYHSFKCCIYMVGRYCIAHLPCTSVVEGSNFTSVSLHVPPVLQGFAPGTLA